MKIETGYDYSDIYLIPRHGVVESRKDTSTKVKFGQRTFDLPVVPANMKTIVDYDTCKFLAQNNLFYIMHRFDVDIVNFCQRTIFDNMYSSISVGVGKESRDDLTKLYNKGLVPDYITIDIAHGDSVMSLKMIEIIKNLFPNTFLIVGNVATAKGVRTLEKAGADATKVGIGQGLVCTTKDATGFTVPQFTAVVNACQEAKKPVIADGGIRCIGDISKAIVGGASMIMAGSLFSGFNENPQLSRQNDGKFLYYGSASAENKGNSTFVEGRVTTIEPKGSMSSLISSLKDGISSAISYSGGKTLEDMRNYTKYGVFHK